ncbi:MAG: ribosome assembly RNA-binding protein YhbY [Gammaproteobacteria bacterium]|nr:MAG: ribosome assembly RNA-binding protein YhbY [Gammaproteobacteria bacterium]
MALTNTQIRFLRARAHSLKPVVLLGSQGLTEAVLNAIDEALEHHELIKVKVRAETRDDKQAIIDAIVEATGAEKIQVVGHNLTLYRAAKNPRLLLPRG